MSQRPTTNSQFKQLNPTAPFPNRETSAQEASTEASSRTPALSPAGGGISRAAHNPPCSPVVSKVPSALNPNFPKQEIPDREHDLTTLRADLKSLVIKNLLASPFLTRFYVGSVISNFPNSNAARILAPNYQKIIDRITMPNPKSCTHIKVTGVRCESPALRGEQFCYFHQHAHRGVRRPPRSRLHPMALIESQESIQASLMEVINGLLRNTLDAKRAELILRALHIAVKNARNVKFDSEVYPKVREVPEYAEPATDDVGTSPVATSYLETSHVGTGAIARPASGASDADPADEYLPAVAAVPYKPVDPRDPHFLERFEEGGRILAREESERRAAEARAATPTVRVGTDAFVRPASTASVPAANTITNTEQRVQPGAAQTASPQRLPQPSRLSKAGNTTVDPTKPAMSVKAAAKTTAAPKERKNAAQRASAG
jgi:hypothetical protein